jgi:hypothetical protein
VSAFVDALLADLNEEDARRLAERLAPYWPKSAAGSWLRGAPSIAKYIGAPASRVYALASAGRIPVQRDGSALVAHTDDLDRWIRAGGGIRP